ncbi:putative dehydrogenase [Bacillus mesophilus]|uniref:Gfo/Idh/MocA family oxidoreductase n=1 Tax=Bacillus mesophilus TaxID=1808955 RepID=A0A6M0QBM5_9BACI|nr:Gfo/Idh/MocA family oxidoreductase [Bacillus mesophilus]MBM7660121.1 putative dehydrogenase [Bacillus mesophilus]NEY73774.1 Gfo/Idh/MocA family oxidoreductase [Bacillus mesophilus]
MKKVRVGIIGCGSITKSYHAPYYHNHPNVELVAFYDRNPERAEQLVAKYGGKAVSSYQEITESPDIDAISDCSSNETHHIISTSALKHGKHVLCEKPLAIGVEQAKELIKVQEESGNILMVNHNQRFLASHQKAKELLLSNILGKVLTFQTTFSHPGPEFWAATKGSATWFFDKNRSGLGVGGDLGVHKIDLLRFLLDDEIIDFKSFEATLEKKKTDGTPIDVADNMVCIMRTAKGAIGTGAFSWTYKNGVNNKTNLYCEFGTMEIDPDTENCLVIRKGAENPLIFTQTELKSYATNSIDTFIHSIINNTPPPVTGIDGLKTIEVLGS